jgi:uncharacterized membrane protein
MTTKTRVVLATLASSGISTSVVPYRVVRFKTTDVGTSGAVEVLLTTSNLP